MSNDKRKTPWSGDTVKKLFTKQVLPPITKPEKQGQVVKQEPLVVEPEPSPILGFSSRKEFRDLTRPLAQKHRGSKIIVSGSSVTGYSFKTGRKFGEHSDIDIGLVDPKLRTSKQVDFRGFPEWSSELGREERRLQKTFREFKGRKTGIKVFSEVPQRTHHVRPHTPPRQRKSYL